MENPFLSSYGGRCSSSLDFISFLSQIHLPRWEGTPAALAVEMPPPALVTAGNGWGQGKGAPQEWLGWEEEQEGQDLGGVQHSLGCVWQGESSGSSL